MRIVGEEQTYKLVEFEEGFAILEPTENLKREGAQPLCLADRQHLIEYLGNYLALRESGKSKREAHELALKAARIQKGVLLHG